MTDPLPVLAGEPGADSIPSKIAQHSALTVPWACFGTFYPFNEKAVKAGINTVCIHKGLLPADYEKSWAGVWEYNTVWDVGKAAKDWPQINFVIYHSALRMFLESPPTG